MYKRQGGKVDGTTEVFSLGLCVSEVGAWRYIYRVVGPLHQIHSSLKLRATSYL